MTTIFETLPKRAQTALSKAGITSDELVLAAIGDEAIYNVPNIGKTSVEAIEKAYKTVGMTTAIKQPAIGWQIVDRRINSRRRK